MRLMVVNTDITTTGPSSAIPGANLKALQAQRSSNPDISEDSPFSTRSHTTNPFQVKMSPQNHPGTVCPTKSPLHLAEFSYLWLQNHVRMCNLEHCSSARLTTIPCHNKQKEQFNRQPSLKNTPSITSAARRMHL